MEFRKRNISRIAYNVLVAPEDIPIAIGVGIGTGITAKDPKYGLIGVVGAYVGMRIVDGICYCVKGYKNRRDKNLEVYE